MLAALRCTSGTGVPAKGFEFIFQSASTAEDTHQGRTGICTVHAIADTLFPGGAFSETAVDTGGTSLNTGKAGFNEFLMGHKETIR